MPVRLDQVPAQGFQTRSTRKGGGLQVYRCFQFCWVWWVFLFGAQLLRQNPIGFLGLALGIPLFCWCLLGFDVLCCTCGNSIADGWDMPREEIRSHKPGAAVLLEGGGEPSLDRVVTEEALWPGYREMADASTC